MELMNVASNFLKQIQSGKYHGGDPEWGSPLEIRGQPTQDKIERKIKEYHELLKLINHEFSEVRKATNNNGVINIRTKFVPLIGTYIEFDLKIINTTQNLDIPDISRGLNKVLIDLNQNPMTVYDMNTDNPNFFMINDNGIGHIGYGAGNEISIQLSFFCDIRIDDIIPRILYLINTKILSKIQQPHMIFDSKKMRKKYSTMTKKGSLSSPTPKTRKRGSLSSPTPKTRRRGSLSSPTPKTRRRYSSPSPSSLTPRSPSPKRTRKRGRKNSSPTPRRSSRVSFVSPERARPSNIKNAVTFILTGNKRNRLLLVLDKKSRTWNIPGGMIDGKERPLEAAYREFNEETGGLTLDKEPTKNYVRTHRNDSKTIIFIFITSKTFSGFKKNNEKDKICFKLLDDLINNIDNPNFHIKGFRIDETLRNTIKELRDRRVI